MDSILNSVKKKLGITSDYTQFDDGDLIDHVNGVFMLLYQLGVGPTDRPFTISGIEEEWTDFSSDIATIELVRPYVAMKVRMAFDPPQTGMHIEALQGLIREYEWRLNVAVDPGESQ